MLEEERLDNALEKIVGLTVKGVMTNFIKKEVLICFENEKSILFSGCALVYDLGIIGCCIGNVSSSAGLGMKQELNKVTKKSEEYFFCSLSRDFKDYKNKNEIRISYRQIKINF